MGSNPFIKNLKVLSLNGTFRRVEQSVLTLNLLFYKIYININPRIGITQARHAGSKSAVGDVMVFLDSHCETNRDWLRPLLQRLKDNYKAVLTPVIDLLQQDTFEYQAGDILDFEVTPILV